MDTPASSFGDHRGTDGAADSSMEAEPAVATLASVWASVEEACAGLSDEQWELPTECPGWSVRDQLSHMIGIERMLLGDPSPAPLTTAPGHVRNPIGEINEAWVDLLRQKPGDEVLAEFAEVTGRRLAVLGATPPTAFDEVGPTLLGTMSLRDFLGRRIFDSWVHEQDVRRALDRPGGCGTTAEAMVLDTVAAAMGKVVGKVIAPPDGTTVQWTVSDTVGEALGGAAGVAPRVVVLEQRGGRAQPVAQVAGAPTVALAMDASTFWRLGCGRLRADQAVAGEAVHIVGDEELGLAVLRASDFMF